MNTLIAPSSRSSELHRVIGKKKHHAATHGMKGTKEYKAWDSIKQRCYNPKHKDYHRYGGAGIVLCPEWHHDFEAFFAYLGHAPSKWHSVDRIDGTKGYEPGNVRWADSITQARNRKDNVVITAFGETKIQEDWCHDPRLACPRTAFLKRLENGWSFERAFVTPKIGFGPIPSGRLKPEPKTLARLHPSCRHLSEEVMNPAPVVDPAQCLLPI